MAFAARVACESGGKKEELLFSWTVDSFPKRGSVNPEIEIQSITTTMANQRGFGALIFEAFPRTCRVFRFIHSLIGLDAKLTLGSGLCTREIRM